MHIECFVFDVDSQNPVLLHTAVWYSVMCGNEDNLLYIHGVWCSAMISVAFYIVHCTLKHGRTRTFLTEKKYDCFSQKCQLIWLTFFEFHNIKRSFNPQEAHFFWGIFKRKYTLKHLEQHLKNTYYDYFMI